MTAVEAGEPRAGFLFAERGVEKRGGDTTGLELVDLIFHQGDQRRNDDGETGAGEGGELEAQRFSAAGGQEREHVFAREGGVDDVALEWAKSRVAEGALQERGKIGRGGGHGAKDIGDGGPEAHGKFFGLGAEG